MAAIAIIPDSHGSDAGISARGGMSVEIVADLWAAEPIWRALETPEGASPYQRFDWVAAYAATAGAGECLSVAVLRGAAGKPVLLLPVSISRRAGLRIASGIGGRHANFHMPVTAGAGAPSPAEMPGLLQEIGRRLAVDVFAFTNVPTLWGGRAVALAEAGRPSASNAYATPLTLDPEVTFQRAVSGDSRKRLRQKERYLAKLGFVAMIEARGEAEIDRVLEAFFRQKEERFRSLGIADPFLAPEVRAFIRTASRPGRSAEPALRVYALTVDGDVVSTFGGAVDAGRISGMFVSFEAGHEAARFSPGDVLVSRVIADSCRRGLGVFDLGVGEARYKSTFCDVTETLVDVLVPVTIRGRLYATATRGALALKRRVKQSPVAMRWVARLRRAKAS